MINLLKIELENTYNLIKSKLIKPYVCFTPNTDHVHFIEMGRYIPKGYVDLDLPSGTIWCQCNLGAEHSYDYGDYYMWARTLPVLMTGKTSNVQATPDNHPYYERVGTSGGSYKSLKYGINNLNELLPEDDAATTLLGEDYKVPSHEDFLELFNLARLANPLTLQTVNNYKGSGIKGILYTNNSTGAELFFPSAGSIIGWEWSVTNDNNIAYYWSSSVKKNSISIHVFSNGNVNDNTFDGFEIAPIRPIYTKYKQ